MNERIQEIKERHAAATPGPWRTFVKDNFVNEDNYRTIIAGVGFYSPPKYVGFGCDLYISEADAELIANAPSDIAYLLSEVERLQTGFEVLSKTPVHVHPSEIRDFAKRILKGESPHRLNE
ncbi:hypothetical protein D3C73_804300 [compost metagenome]